MPNYLKLDNEVFPDVNPTATCIRRRWWKVILKNVKKIYVLLVIQVYVNTEFWSN